MRRLSDGAIIGVSVGRCRKSKVKRVYASK
jgi:hypothetical protein